MAKKSPRNGEKEASAGGLLRTEPCGPLPPSLACGGLQGVSISGAENSDMPVLLRPMPMEHRYIAIEGPIGVGKSALAQMLATSLGARLLSEAVEDNPFLGKFYADRKKHAFQTQIFFLLSRYQQQQELFQQDLFHTATVSDYLFDKDRLFASLTLDPNELALYDRVFETLAPRGPKPDLVVYLQARLDVLLQRIRRRGRDFERKLDPQYLEELCRVYNGFFFHYSDTPLLVVDTSEIDFVQNEKDLASLMSAIGKMKKGVQHYIPR